MTSFEWLLVAFGVVFWPLCIGSAVASTGGRYLLALLSSRWARKLLSPKQRQNVSALGNWLNQQGCLSLFDGTDSIEPDLHRGRPGECSDPARGCRVLPGTPVELSHLRRHGEGYQ